MIDGLDRTLEMFLKEKLPPALVKQVTISFAPPDDKFPPSKDTLPAIDLFLYDIRENRELRNNEWLVEGRSDGMVTEKRAPVRVDCSYLITAWFDKSSKTADIDEHGVLGEVMKVMLRFPTIPPQLLQGSLKGQAPDLPTVVLQPGHLQSVAEFWQALGGKPKAALNYTVTIGVEPFEPIETPAVEERIVDIQPDVEK